MPSEGLFTLANLRNASLSREAALVAKIVIDHLGGKGSMQQAHGMVVKRASLRCQPRCFKTELLTL